MANNTRNWARRKITFAEGNLNQAGAHLQEVVDIYDKHHPEITTPILTIQTAIMELISGLQRIRGLF